MVTPADLLRENRFRPEEIPAFERKLFFEGPRRRPYLERFGVLLFLATVIATVGVISDSTATVIGAMIIAPLMLPIMATAAALVMGQMGRALQSSLLVAAGAVGVIGLSWLAGLLYPGAISFTTNSQILGRTSPRLLDLIAALASGAAGAFCLSRDDISDSLPGVAIAISLVPPLCVVGLSLAYGQWGPAGESLLLFLTNMLAILLAGGGLLALLGLGRAATVTLQGHARRNAFLVIVGGVLLVTIPLSLTGARVTTDMRTQATTSRVAAQWLSGSQFEVIAIKVGRDSVAITIRGPGEPPPFEQLLANLDTTVGSKQTVELEVVPAQKRFHRGTDVAKP